MTVDHPEFGTICFKPLSPSECADVPPAVNDFVYLFDEGEYPRLDRRAGNRPGAGTRRLRAGPPRGDGRDRRCLVIQVSKGDRFIWNGAEETDTIPVQVEVIRVARDESWADIFCTVNGISFWSKRQQLPFPATFQRVIGGAS